VPSQLVQPCTLQHAKGSSSGCWMGWPKATATMVLAAFEERVESLDAGAATATSGGLRLASRVQTSHADS